jgi:hypothetical protein
MSILNSQFKAREIRAGNDSGARRVSQRYEQKRANIRPERIYRNLHRFPRIWRATIIDDSRLGTAGAMQVHSGAFMNRPPRVRLQALLLGALIAFVCHPVIAQPAPAPVPVPAPASAPASTRPAAPIPAADQTTPRGALRVLTEGMTTGDGNAIRSVLKSDTPQENTVLDTLVGVYDATAKFGKTAEETFGAEEARKLTGDRSAMLSEQLMQLAMMPEKVEGDAAYVGDAPQQVQLAKVDGKWRVPVGKLVGDKEPGQVDAVLADMKTQTKIWTDVTAEIKAEKYKTAEEAGQALQLRMMKAAMDAQAAATQPGAASQTGAAPATQQSSSRRPGVQ